MNVFPALSGIDKNLNDIVKKIGLLSVEIHELLREYPPKISQELEKSNVFGQRIKPLDQLANDMFVKSLLKMPPVHAIISEELDKPTVKDDNSGTYVVTFDPIDGSTNIELNNAIGTIFSIYKKTPNLLTKGRNLLVSGYTIYSHRLELMLCANHNVTLWQYLPSAEQFSLVMDSVKIPSQGKTYAFNEANFEEVDPKIQKFIHVFHEQKPKYKQRYLGTMAAEVHRTVLKGGFYLFPRNNRQKEGQIRLVIEINPLTNIIETAGGKAYSDDVNPLDIDPTSFTDIAPIILGSTFELDMYKKIACS